MYMNCFINTDSKLYRFQTIVQLIAHLVTTHNIKTETKTLLFSNMTEFLQWKEQEERVTNSSYVKHSSSKTYGESEHYYYYCNRTGIYIGKVEGKRQLKTQGNSKINMHCIAHMKAVHKIKTDEVNVQYCTTHRNQLYSISSPPYV